MRMITKLAALAAMVAFGVNCGGGGGSEPNDPTPGDLTVSLSTPNSDDAAIKVTITGPEAPTAIASAAAGVRLFSTGTLATTNTVVLTGAMNDGPLLTLTVPDTRDADEYTVTVVQVASTNYTIRATAGYTFAVAD